MKFVWYAYIVLVLLVVADFGTTAIALRTPPLVRTLIVDGVQVTMTIPGFVETGFIVNLIGFPLSLSLTSAVLVWFGALLWRYDWFSNSKATKILVVALAIIRVPAVVNNVVMLYTWWKLTNIVFYFISSLI